MRGRRYILYSVITTMLEGLAGAAIVLWLLPLLEIHLPLWSLAIVMAAIGIWGFIGYRLTRDVVNREDRTPASAMIGCTGKATTPIDPKGVVHIRGELWEARANTSPIRKDEEIVVVGIEGLILFVEPLSVSAEK